MADPAVELPSGNSAAFRQVAMETAAQAQVLADTLPAMPRTRPATRLQPLPRLSSAYGYRSDPVHGTSRMHRGIDIPGPAGTPILASEGGIVSFAGPAGSYGNLVEIDHGSGLRTRYAHLSRIFVVTGEPIAREQIVALMGSTGRSTGSHLHFEVRRNGSTMDPLEYFKQESPSPANPRMWNRNVTPHISQFAQSRTRKIAPDEDGL